MSELLTGPLPSHLNNLYSVEESLRMAREEIGWDELRRELLAECRQMIQDQLAAGPKPTAAALMKTQ